MALPTIYSIPLAEACEYTRRWRERGNNIKAFTIDVAELNDVISELSRIIPEWQMTQIRVYFGIKDNDEECLVLVGLDSQGNDITSYIGGRGVEESGTYDFTRPCPDTCDTGGSPLLND